MKTTNTQTTAKVENDKTALAKLNALYAKYSRAHDLLMKEYDAAFRDMDDAFWGKKKAVKLASAKFNLLRRSLPETKFDMDAGEYFYAQENGQEVFAVKVSRTESCTMRVIAKNAEAAKKAALAIVKADEKLLERGELVSEDVSR